MNEANSSAAAITPNDLRPLKCNEVVKLGDFVRDGRKGFELWEGPSGFRADAFIKTIYRRNAGQPAVAAKSP